jgi:hypothetical protein
VWLWIDKVRQCAPHRQAQRASTMHAALPM